MLLPPLRPNNSSLITTTTTTAAAAENKKNEFYDGCKDFNRYLTPKLFFYIRSLTTTGKKKI
jgi:hypothetical protein